MDSSWLPTVFFSTRGNVSAANAVDIDPPTKHDKTYAVYVLHPQGGRIYISWEPTKEDAERVAHSLQGVLTAWVMFGMKK